ncbi:Gfo/Idh/MocA family protein [Streptomyces sp. NBC_00091]|uniref:Gfo/Idh/MocA family protein n=1 Tax=Streptomyces sp. NBC_00091 TaxID=2975648 RepID=UPI00225A68ED|nr:Gfo/Idh/MocA family oxidoreductase [Streptomyces sp. NBC_00091]MCX5381170.1 Gfo/Idh/MocA family oxidoreductase [Streptomyces sp. NBC_00091]
MPAPLRLGLLGCGDIAARRTLPALARTPELALAAVAAREPARAAAFAARFGGEPAASYEELLARPDVDAVYLCLPTVLHAHWAERALRAGKHVLVEKPLATNGADAERLFVLAAQRRLVLLENFMFLHHATQATVTGLLASGALGTVRAVSAAFTIPPRPDGDTRYDPALGGGALLDNGVYPLRAALRFLGDRLTVAGAVLRHDERHGVDLSGSVLLAAPDGAAAQLRFGMEHHYRSWYEVQGSAGTLSVEQVYTTAPDHAPVVRLCVGTDRSEIRVPAEDHFEAVLRFFARAVANPERTGSGLPLLDAESRRQAGLLDEIRAAAVRISV